MSQQVFTGHIYVYQAFDVGDDIKLDDVREKQLLLRRPSMLSKYFKNYHTPLQVELPHPHTSSRIETIKLHEFGVISLVYKIPFSQTLEELRGEVNGIVDEYNEQSVIDAGAIFNKIKTEMKQPKFFHLRTSYVLIQINPVPGIGTDRLKDESGNMIASILRFETVSLSKFLKNEILDSSIGYYRGNLIVVDTEAAIIYDEEYEDILDLFEFSNMQLLELQYFDRLLDQQLNTVYERGVQKIPYSSFLPFVRGIRKDPIAALGKLKVDISVITERLESSIKLVGEEYYSEIYALLVKKLDIRNWQKPISRKLNIIFDLRSVYESKIHEVRQDILEVLIILLIFIELVVGIAHYFK